MWYSQLEIKVWIRDKNSGPSSNRHLSIVGNQSLTRSCFQTLRPWSRVVYNIFFPCVGEHYENFPKLSRDGQNRNFRESPKDRKISTNLKNEYRQHSGGLEFPWFQLTSQNAHSNDTLELLSFHEHAKIIKNFKNYKNLPKTREMEANTQLGHLLQQLELIPLQWGWNTQQKLKFIINIVIWNKM